MSGLPERLAREVTEALLDGAIVGARGGYEMVSRPAAELIAARAILAALDEVLRELRKTCCNTFCLHEGCAALREAATDIEALK